MSLAGRTTKPANLKTSSLLLEAKDPTEVELFLRSADGVKEANDLLDSDEDQLVERTTSLHLSDKSNAQPWATPIAPSAIVAILRKCPELRNCTLIGVHMLQYMPARLVNLTCIVLFNVHFGEGIDVIRFINGLPLLRDISTHYVTSHELLERSTLLTIPLQSIALSSNRTYHDNPPLFVACHDHLLRWIILNPSHAPPIRSLTVWDITNSTANLVKEAAITLSSTLKYRNFFVKTGQTYAYRHLSAGVKVDEFGGNVVQWID